MRLFTGIKKIFREIFYPVTATLLLLSPGCNLQVKFLPQIRAPYISEVEFLKQVNQNGPEIKKIPFENGVVPVTFYMFIKLENIENQGRLRVRFYRRVKRFPIEVIAAANARQRRILANLFMVLPLPVPSAWIEWTDLARASNVGAEIDLISAYGRGCFRSALQVMVFPLIFNLDHFCVVRYEKNGRELFFPFGENGKYYEYIVFIDKIRNFEPGDYRFAIFLNDRLMLEDSFEVRSFSKKN
jgi:hypothetical protein